MTSYDDDEDIDIEALFEAELAKVTAFDDPISLDDDDFEGASSSEELDGQEEALEAKEDAPLQRLRAAFARRDVALEELERTLQHTREEVSALGGSAPRDTPSDGLASGPAEAGLPSTGPPPIADDLPAGKKSGAGRQATAPTHQPTSTNPIPQGTSTADTAATVLEGSAAIGEPSCQHDAGDLELAHHSLLDARRYQDELECLAVISETEAELAAASAEQERQAREQEEMARRLEQAARSAAERAAAREAVAEAIRQETMEMARRHVAARRIARAWLRFRARGARDRAAVRIQAAWRGCVGRRATARVRREREGTQEVSARLQSAALNGDYMQYKAAMAAAQGNPQLARLVVESSQAFLARKTAVEGKLRAAVSGQPIAEVAKLLEEAVGVGIESGLLTEIREAARRRDAQVAMELSATGQGCSNTLPFELLAERGLRLGLKGDVAATRLALDRRRRILTVELHRHRRGATASAAAMTAMIREARRIGMVAEAAELEQHLRQRQEHLQTALAHSASHASATCFARMLQGASQLGVPPSLLLAANEALRQRQSLCRQVLTTVTTTTSTQSPTLRSALLARGAAASCGTPLLDLLAADRALHCRRLAAATDLDRALRHVCSALLTPLGWQAIKDRGLWLGLRLGQPRLVLERAVGQQVTTTTSGGPMTARTGHTDGRQKRPEDTGVPVGGGDTRRGGAGEGGSEGFAAAPPGFYLDSLNPSQPPDVLASLDDSQMLQGWWRSGPVLSGRITTTTTTTTTTADSGGGVSGSMNNNIPAPSCVVSGHVSRISVAPSAARAFGWLREACSLLWSSLVLTLQLGLSGMAVLALCMLELNQLVQLADGQHVVCCSVLAHDYWGVPQLPRGGRDAAACRRSEDGVVVGTADTERRQGSPPPDGGLRLDSLAMRVLSCPVSLGVGTDMRLWELAGDPMAQLTSTTLCPNSSNNSSNLSASTPAAPKATSTHQPADSSSMSRNAAAAAQTNAAMPVPAPCSALRAIVLQNAPAGTSSLTSIVSLDLGLERLSSLVGLDVLCPGLRCLSADANELRRLDGLSSLTRLQELSLKHNLLTTLGLPRGAVQGAGKEGGGLPPGRALRTLALDSIRLDGVLCGLQECSGLRKVSLADNTLTDIGDAFHASAGALTSLVLRNNRLTSLPLAMASLTNLHELDVSCNQLTSLDGIQSLMLLRSLSGQSNAVHDLPRPLFLPYLTSLDLSQNTLSKFHLCHAKQPPIVLPLLKTLLLGCNQLSSIGPLGLLKHLTTLNISSNQLKLPDITIALAGLSGLQQLHIDDNPGTSAPARYGAGAVQQLGSLQPSASALALQPGLRLLAPWLRELDHEEVSRTTPNSTPNRSVTGGAATCHFAAASLLAATAVTRSVRARDTYAAVRCCSLEEATARSTAASMSAVGLLRHTRIGGGGGHQQRSVAQPGRRCLPTILPTRQQQQQQASLASYHGLVVASPVPDNWLPAAPHGAPDSHSWHSWRDAGAAGATTSATTTRRPADGPLRPPQQTGSLAPSTHTRLLHQQPAASSWLLRQEERWRMTALTDIAERHQHRPESPIWPHGKPHSTPQSASLTAAPASNMTSRGLPSLIIHPAGDAAVYNSRSRAPARALCWLANVRAQSGPSSAAIGPTATATAAVLTQNKLSGAALEVLASEIDEFQQGVDVSKQHRALDEVQQCLKELSAWGDGDSSKSGGGQATTAQQSPSLVVHPSYLLYRMGCEAHCLLSRLQSVRHWVGSERCEVAVLRRLKARQHAAALTIQSWWRGHNARTKMRLAAQEAHVAAMAMQADGAQREAAAMKIQSYFRGHMVRKKLRTAFAAARRLPRFDADLDNLDSFLASDELDSMLNGLRPVESLLAESGLQISLPADIPPLRQQMPLPAATHHHYQQHPYGSTEDTRTGGNRGAIVAPLRLAPTWSVTGATTATEPAGDGVWAADSRKLPPMSTQPTGPGSPMLSGNPPHRLTALQGPNSNTQGALLNNMELNLSPHQQQQQQFGNPAIQSLQSGPAAGYQHGHGMTPSILSPPALLQIPSVSDPHQVGRGTSSQQATPLGSISDVMDNGASSSSTPGVAGQHEEGGLAQRDRRYRERLTALMAEWGFTNMATAEAYLRRTTRHKPRKELEARHRNPNLSRQAPSGQPPLPARLQALPQQPAQAAASSRGSQQPCRSNILNLADSDHVLPSTRPQRSSPSSDPSPVKAHSTAGTRTSTSSAVPADGLPQLSNRSASLRSNPASEPSTMRPRAMPRSADGRIIGQSSAPASPDVGNLAHRRQWLTPPEPLPSAQPPAGRRPVPCVLPTLTNNWVASPQQHQGSSASKGSYVRPAVKPLSSS